MFKFKVNVSAVFKFKVEGLDSLVKFRPLPITPLIYHPVLLLLSGNMCKDYCSKIQFNNVHLIYMCSEGL